MSTVTIQGTLIGSLGLRDRKVAATLCDLNGTPQLGYVNDVEGEIVTEITAAAKPDGSWSMRLYGNDDITSDFGDTIYRITEGPGFNRYGSNTYYVGVPTSGGPYWVVDLKVTPPGGAAPQSFAVVSVDGRTGAVDLSDKYATIEYVDENSGGGASGDYLPLSGGTLTGALTLSGDPTNDLHAATKGYVDEAVSNVSGGVTGDFLPLSGGTMTGDLVLAGNPSEALEAAPKQYVDGLVDDYLPLAGGTLTGALTLSGAPTNNLHAATKLYVDNETVRATAAESLLAPKASPTFTGTVSGITKSMVGLGNVDNTSDANKPVSTATQTALNLKANLASPTFTGTVTTSDLTVGGDLSVSGVGQRQFIRTTSNQNISSSAQTATNLVLPVVANGKYLVRAGIIITNTAGTFAPSWTGPSGATMKWNNTTASADYSSTIGATNGTFPQLATSRMIFLEGLLQVSSTSGNLTFTCSTTGGTLSVLTDSYLILDRLV